VKALVAGWFSYEGSDFTAGDLLACDVVSGWLAEANVPFDIAVVPPLSDGVDIHTLYSRDYPLVIFVCGPFMRNRWEADFLGQFADSFLIGVNLSMPFPLREWNPFDVLIERDSDRLSRPDISLLSGRTLLPVVGLCLCEPYDEADVARAHGFVERLARTKPMVCVPIDTRLDANATGLRSKAEVETLLARMDAVVTTRLHGTVLSLRNGVPALVIDPEPGGGRIRRQAEALGWPFVFSVDQLDDAVLASTLDRCLTPEARSLARRAATNGADRLRDLRGTFAAAVAAAGRTSKREERAAFAAKLGWIAPSRESG
jgi:hypothetical protein